MGKKTLFCWQFDDYDPEVGAIGKHPDEGDSGNHDEGHEVGDKDPGPDEGHEVDDKDPGPEEGHEAGGEGPGHDKDGEDAGPDKGDGGSETGVDDDNDPAHIVATALLCFEEKHIYVNCEESYRLTVSGELHVPHDHVDEFCSGPCLEETNLALHCIDSIMDHFLFYNKATTEDVRDTILAGCGHGDKRGDFNVAEHIEAGEGSGSIGSKVSIPVLFSIGITIVGQIVLL